MSVSDTPWSNEMALMRSKCYCLRKDLQQTWWTCFYQQAALCPKDQVTMREIWRAYCPFLLPFIQHSLDSRQWLEVCGVLTDVQ
jgi:hypothetical protein